MIFIHFCNSFLFSLSPITLIFDSVPDFLTNIRPCPFISFFALFIELFHAPCEVVDVESICDANSEIGDLEIEPVGVTSGIAVDLHK